jgi:hypothetical protein
MTPLLRSRLTRPWLALTLVLGTGSAMAGMCGSGPDQNVPGEIIQEERLYRTLFTQADYHGIEKYNRILLDCNRRRDSLGGGLRRELGQFGSTGFSTMLTQRDLDWKMVRGNYNFYGNEFFGQKYVYLLRKTAGVWEVILPYKAEVNDVVKDRVDFFIGNRKVIDGEKGTIASSDKSGPAWSLYEASQVQAAGDGSGRQVLKTGAQPIASTLCSSATFSSSSSRYDNQNGFFSHKRDHENRHVSLGLIQFRYAAADKPKDKEYASVKEGCRVRDDVDLYWVSPESLDAAGTTARPVAVRTGPKAWVFDNFIRVGQEFWSRAANFRLRMWLRGYNDQAFTAEERSRFLDDDFLTVRFATKFMPYGGNQMYKSNPVQFNNFSTMTTDGTFMHEVGHAFGLDDEYGGGKNNDCEGETYSKLAATLPGGVKVNTEDYQMCSGYSDAVVTTVYQYIAVSRYTTKQRECKDDGNCAKGEWCNAGLDLNKNQCQAKAADGDACPLVGGDHACESGQCKLGRCYTPRSADIGDACFFADVCRSDNCNNPVGGGAGRCVCKQDSDCGASSACKQGALGLGTNHCVATRAPSCKEGWSYDVRDPLNKDRCARTSTQTARLECKLLITDKKDNWTGPHAMPGADVCRSTKGKDAKDVKCPGGFQYTVRDGADTCTKSSTEHETPSCPAGWDYKSRSGRDMCEAPG